MYLDVSKTFDVAMDLDNEVAIKCPICGDDYGHASDIIVNPKEWAHCYKDERVYFAHLYRGECGHYYVVVLGNHKGFPIINVWPFDLESYHNRPIGSRGQKNQKNQYMPK